MHIAELMKELLDFITQVQRNQQVNTIQLKLDASIKKQVLNNLNCFKWENNFEITYIQKL